MRWCCRYAMRVNGESNVDAVLHFDRAVEKRQWRDAEFGLIERQSARYAQLLSVHLDLNWNPSGPTHAVHGNRCAQVAIDFHAGHTDERKRIRIGVKHSTQ